MKNVYASKKKVGKKYPNGTVIVKTIVEPGTKYVGQVAVMRKVDGRWRFVEYELSSPGATPSSRRDSSASTATWQARANDYVFTKR